MTTKEEKDRIESRAVLGVAIGIISETRAKYDLVPVYGAWFRTVMNELIELRNSLAEEGEK